MPFHYKRLESIIAEYDGLTGDELNEALRSDGRKFSDEDIAEMTAKIAEVQAAAHKEPPAPVAPAKPVAAVVANKKHKTPEQIKAEQDNHPFYKWFDEFESRIIKKEVINPYNPGTKAVIIVGWELGKKLAPKFIEPRGALSQNAFALGAGDDGKFKFLLLKGANQNGDLITYKEWAIAQGLDLETDINILLNK